MKLHLHILSSLVLLFVSIGAIGQIPPGYYDTAIGKDSVFLQQALHNIIDNHTVVSYSSIKSTHHGVTDIKPNGQIWDMYSDVPGGTPPYTYQFIDSDKCGNYSGEGDCYNREHSFPQSWFNSQSPMKTDLFHVYATDGYVNGKRSSYPYGEVSNPTWTSQNGSKLGPNTFPGSSGTCFEPLDEYKGDFARTYFYMAVRYYNEDNGWDNNTMVDGSQLKPWALQMMYQWHLADTVSQKEIDRNNAIYGIQGNRNPFIDRPDWVDSLWFPVHVQDTTGGNSINDIASYKFTSFPNPSSDVFHVFSEKRIQNARIEIFSTSGQRVYMDEPKAAINHFQVATSELKNGVYLVFIYDGSNRVVYQQKLIVL
jgi:endonuclease I